MSNVPALPNELDRRFEALIFDWDGTAVPDRATDASALCAAVESACLLGLDLAVVSGTHVGNIDGQLRARPRGPGELHLLLNRGSEVYRVNQDGVELTARLTASEAQELALDRAAALTVQRLRACGLEARIVSQRLNRRKIDLIPIAAWADPPKARIGELLTAVEARLREHGLDGLQAAVELSEAAAAEAGLTDARVTSDAKHIEIGLTDKADSARWYFEHLWRRGVSPEQVLIVGDELGPLGGLPGSDSMLLIDAAAGATVASVGVEPAGVPDGIISLHGGPAAFSGLLDRQLALRRRGALPIVSSDPCWTLAVDGVGRERERANEALLTIADGCLGTRGSVLAPGRGATPAVLMAGVYRGHGEFSELQPAPLWNRLAARASGGRVRRVLDLHAGVLCQQMPGELAALQFCSLAEPGVAVLRALAPRATLEAGPPLVAPPHTHAERQDDGAVILIPVANGTLEAAAVQSIAGAGEDASLERIAVYAATSAGDSSKPALRRAHRARQAGRERLLGDHRRAWARRWEHADVRIDGDPELQVGIRLALFHLIACAGDHGEAAVGARALTGRGYRGHVFWDSDVFVLPFLAATHPASARAILEYRVRRLPSARAAARAAGHAGARFAWESAASGEDVTPRSARDRAGHEVAIYTGQREEHIVADVAWAAGCYIDWTGDRAFREGAGRRLLVETARYWASRVERDSDGTGGRAHIRGVIGPDEYHELVDDNAYTNVMASWNLRRAFAETTDGAVERAERRSWLDLADALVDGYHPDSGLYEQFAGFFALEPLVISEIAPRRPIAADLLLSPERVHQAQVVKQADVLMLHHLVPDEVVEGSLAANLAFYEPRTAHSSSLSPGVHAALLARAGRLDEARAALAMTTRIDLDDESGATASGVHIAAMGSVWQALALGFLGARPRGDVLELEPRIAEGWELLELRLRFRAAQLCVRVNAQTIEVSSDRPTLLSVAGGETVSVGPSPRRFPRE
ncbi:MAG TPA: glycosyl hydrolase family 65 protein [Solirubrobacteraceae bacterium]|nr:glycosyl hydrolase family 65 protein [Solirubrobacteraceae bacterium]